MTINIDPKAIAAGCLTAGLIFRKVMAFVSHMAVVLQPTVQDAENRAKDHLIDRADRKAIAMNGVRDLENAGVIKLNFVTRFVVSKVVDDVAQMLPDFKFN